jgi:hypothetical protein
MITLLSLKHRLLLLLIIAISMGSAVAFSTQTVRAETPPCVPYDPVKEDPPFCAGDQRVNPYDAIATVTAYCQADHSLKVDAIINSEGVFMFVIPASKISASLQRARSSNAGVLIDEKYARQVWALASGELYLNDYSSGYHFQFPGNRCGAVSYTDTTVRPAQPSQPIVNNPQPSAPVKPSAPVQPSTAGQQIISLNTVTTGRVNIRTYPSKDSGLLATAQRGEVVMILGRDQSWNWVKLVYKGTTGWASSQYAGISNRDLGRLSVVR